MLKNKQGFMNKHKFNAFTLAEMMVVMLIMSIVLAAMAPVMTTKNKVDNSSPWKYSPNNSSDAYFGQGASMRAMIGQLNGEDTDNGKLIINNLGSSFSHILFKNGNTILGDLYMSGNNLILGHRNGSSTSLGQNNINIGPNNWPSTDITGQSNIIIGDNAMTHLSTGSNNIGLGTTLTALTTGTGNVTIGDNSLIGVTTGSGNIGLGNGANPAITTASKTIAIGANSVASSLGAIAIGSNIERGEGTEKSGAIARGGGSIAIGNGAICNYEDDVNGLSIAIGTDAKANSEDDSVNAAIAIGYGADSNSASTIAIGTTANATGGSAVAIGTEAKATGGRSIAIGPSNGTGDGDNEGSTMAAGQNSIALGIGAYARGADGIAIGQDTTANIQDIAIGREAVALSDVNGSTIAIGYQAMKNSKSSANSIAIGKEALYNNGSSGITSGWDNIGIGYRALMNNTSGSDNTAVGVLALRDNTTGSHNTAIGEYACSNVTGSNKTCIGYNSGPSNSDQWAKDDKERIFIGSRSNYNNAPAVLEVHNLHTKSKFKYYSNKSDNATSVVINGNLIVKGRIVTNPEVFHNNYVYDYCALAITAGKGEDYAYYRYCGPEAENLLDVIASDRRLKYVGKDNNDGLAKIKQLKVFNYVYKKDTTKTPHVGVIAQDLQKVFPNAVQKGKDGFLTIRMEDMFYAVINAIKELDAKYQAQEKRINDLEKRIEKLEAKSK